MINRQCLVCGTPRSDYYTGIRGYTVGELESLGWQVYVTGATGPYAWSQGPPGWGAAQQAGHDAARARRQETLMADGRGKQPSKNQPNTATPKDKRLASTPGHKKPGPKTGK